MEKLYLEILNNKCQSIMLYVIYVLEEFFLSFCRLKLSFWNP